MIRFSFALVTTILVFLISSCGGAQNPGELETLRIGMNKAGFISLFPDAYQDTGNPDRFIRTDSIYGLQGRWVYHFSNNTLSWFVFTASQQDISKENFTHYLNVAMELEKSYDLEYGKPVKIRKGIQDYRDPNEQSHSGYLVHQASWEGPEGKRTVEFTFLGDHRNYSLLLTIQVGN